MPAVSVIVPNYNHEKYLTQRIESILNQTFQDFEIIILDDCSTDNSKEIIEKYRANQKVSNIIYNDINSGTSYKQWYKGIEYAKGGLIWIAESDDWCDLNFLSKLVPFFDDTEVVLTFSSTKSFNEGESVQRSKQNGGYEKYIGDEFICHKMILRNQVYNASMCVFRKQRYEMVKNKGFLKMNLCGDWLLWIQIMQSHKVVYVMDILNYNRWHDSNATSRFRADGYDFIEGMNVLRYSKQICGRSFNRKEVYLSWVDYYKILLPGFAKGTRWNVLTVFLRREPLLFFFMIYKYCRSGLKRLFK
jgi:glycosyltransferase involved in cell wall biosynthesis